MVVGDGLDADEQAPAKTDCPDDARTLEAWYDEHDLRNRSWEQVVDSSCACLADDRLVCKSGDRKISSMEWRFLVLRVGSSEKKLESGDKDCRELPFWNRVNELAGCCGQLSLDGGANLGHVALVIRSSVDAVSEGRLAQSESLRYQPSNWRCKADSLRRQVALKDKEERELNPGRRRQQWRDNRGVLPRRRCLHPDPSILVAIETSPKARTKGRRRRNQERMNAASDGAVVTPAPTS